MSNFTNNFIGTGVSYDAGMRSYMLKIYNLMSMALGVTGLSAIATVTFPPLMSLMFKLSPSGAIMGTSGFGYLILFSPLIISFYFSAQIHKMSTSSAQTLFWAFAVLMGMSLAPITLIYTGESIARTFFITSSIFAAMSIYGYTTKRDLTNFGSFLMMGLFGIIIASIVNFFMPSSFLNFAISVIGVLVFTGLTAYDTQKIKNMYHASRGIDVQKISIMAALNLYLDFINLFMMLLRFTGSRRN